MPHPAPVTASIVHPPVGTLIDNDSLELVEVLGIGGYGVAYRAVDTRSSLPRSYAVKCLAHSPHTTLNNNGNGPHPQSHRRQVHIQEIALHQLASAHPGVVTLNRVVEDFNYTYIVMEYAPDGDLFTQILNQCRYLGNNKLIMHIFMQLVDAVEYCHSLGIYHRDLKPENVLCFDDGRRVALTDFGLATTAKISEEFRTGSVYHMSPECHGGIFAPTGAYSPMFNDVWSLGIILLNLATGRNPWKSATANDPTFQAYLRDPAHFLPTVLPISFEINDVLVRMLEVDWRERMTLRELRDAMEGVTNFYSDGVVFEGSMARCPWEAGVEIESDSSTKGITQAGGQAQEHAHAGTSETEVKSYWSKDSASEIVFARHSMAEQSSFGEMWTANASEATWAVESDTTSHYALARGEPSYIGISRSGRDSSMSRGHSDSSSMPVTPNGISFMFPAGPQPRLRKPLTIDTQFRNPRPRYYNWNLSDDSYSPGSSMMQTALETPDQSSMFLGSPGPQSGESKGMSETIDMITTAGAESTDADTAWTYTSTEVSSPMSFAPPPRPRSPDRRSEVSYLSPSTPSPEVILWQDPWHRVTIGIEDHQPTPSKYSPARYEPEMEEPPSPSSPSPSSSPSPLPSLTPTPPRPSFFTIRKSQHGKSRSSSIFSPMKFFPRSPPSTSPTPPKPNTTRGRRSTDPFPSYTPKQKQQVLPPPQQNQPQHQQTHPSPTWADFMSPKASAVLPVATQERHTRRISHLRSPRYWFLTGKFFAANASP